MTLEDQHTDRKSLRTVAGKMADWDALAKDCVCFANSAGGRLLIGIEDGETLPPVGQTVPADFLDRLRKRIGELIHQARVAAVGSSPGFAAAPPQ